MDMQSHEDIKKSIDLLFESHKKRQNLIEQSEVDNIQKCIKTMETELFVPNWDLLPDDILNLILNNDGILGLSNEEQNFALEPDMFFDFLIPEKKKKLNRIFKKILCRNSYYNIGLVSKRWRKIITDGDSKRFRNLLNYKNGQFTVCFLVVFEIVSVYIEDDNYLKFALNSHPNDTKDLFFFTFRPTRNSIICETDRISAIKTTLAIAMSIFDEKYRDLVNFFSDVPIFSKIANKGTISFRLQTKLFDTLFVNLLLVCSYKANCVYDINLNDFIEYIQREKLIDQFYEKIKHNNRFFDLW